MCFSLAEICICLNLRKIDAKVSVKKYVCGLGIKCKVAKFTLPQRRELIITSESQMEAAQIF